MLLSSLKATIWLRPFHSTMSHFNEFSNITQCFPKCSISLEKLNDTERQQRIPPMIYLGVLICIGLPSNITVILVFLKYFKKSTYRTYIVTLAIIDLTACALCMPFEIFEMVFQYTFYWDVMCKTFRFLNTVVASLSNLVIFGLSLDRCRRVCKPLKHQFTVTEARIFCFGTFLLCLLLSAPILWISGIRHVKLEQNITGYDCGTADTYRKSMLPLIHNISLFIVFAFNFTSLFVIYTKIAISICRQNRNRQTLQEIDSTRPNQRSPVYVINKMEENPRNGLSHSLPQTRSTRNTVSNRKSNSLKITKIAFAINLLYILSYLPYLILNIWTSAKGSFVAKPGPLSSALLPIVTRTVFINNICNPILYSFFDSRFRNNVKNIMCSCFKK